MTARTRGRATYNDLLAAPENLVAELVDGELYTWPRPSRRHIRIASRLGMRLGPPFDFGEGGPGGWWIFDEPELHLGRNVLVPDLAGWRRERLAGEPDDDHRFRVPPDWVCEVLSPSTSRFDMQRKLPIYADHEIPYAWVINPAERALHVYALKGGDWVVAGTYFGEDKVRAVPFDAVEIDLASIWGPDPLPDPESS